MNNTEYEEKKEKIYSFIKSDLYKPMKVKELAVLLCVPRAEKEEFKELTDKLISDGKLITDSKGRLKLAGEDTVAGIFMGTAKGFGFVRIENQNEDIFIPADYTNGAHDKDKVLVKISESSNPAKRSREGVVISVLERNSTNIVGTFQRTKTYGFVIPDNAKFGGDVYIPHGFTKGAVTGHKVEVEITDFGGAGRNAEGHVVDIIGHIDDPRTDIVSVIRAYGIPLDFPEGVINQLSSIPSEINPDDIPGRLDLRDVQTVTIDSETAKDLDDAITLSKNGDIYQLGVHIADVTNYVTENSPLDKEALKRGTSNYLVDSVIPMLPHELSNGICSLNQGTDRLALSCIMDINQKGEVVGHQIAETVINVDRRMTYTNVQKVVDVFDACENYAAYLELLKKVKSAELSQDIIDGYTEYCRIEHAFLHPEDATVLDKHAHVSEINTKVYTEADYNKAKKDYADAIKAFTELYGEKMVCPEIGDKIAVFYSYRDFADMFVMSRSLSEILRARRHKRGSIDFDIPECNIVVNDKGEPIDIRPYDRNRATKIIEDFMLIANETVAEDYFWQELPFVYRTHDTPDTDKINKLLVFINNFGYSIKLTQDEVHPKEFQKLLEKIEGTDEEALITRLTLRSMKQAKYTVECDGHFGLAAKYYCHFTSPIRRYPDLQIHRIIKENLNGKLTDKRISHYNSILSEVSFQSSKCERRADEAEREVQKLKKVEFMEPHIGEVFEGVISGVNSSGLYIELPTTVEGNVKIEKIEDDFYIFDDQHYMLVGSRTHKELKLGERIKVKLIAVDKLTRSIEFIPVDDTDD
ncbi:MAG: RNB domain-containing ribonuclease [Lachnospiraceae bacterium]|nr:RNB domain-containing ribonuclease [Lachnospiraceae bacterium]